MVGGVWWGMRGRGHVGVCMAGGMHWGRGVCMGACMAGGVWWGGACVAGKMAIAAGGMHPTGMHSCYRICVGLSLVVGQCK